MTLCVGIDISTKRIDLAAIPLDPEGEPAEPVRVNFLVQRVGDPKDAKRPIDYQRISADMRDSIRLLEEWDTGPFYVNDTVVTACVETPAGRMHPTMLAVYGAVLASLPSRITAASIYPVQWRKRLGLAGRDSKDGGHALVRAAWPASADWDEHELDALGIATAWRTIQWEAVAI